MQDLKGKCAIVTGAASGIGLAISQLLSSLGVKLIMTDINDEGLKQVQKDTCKDALTMVHDVSSEADWNKVISLAKEKFGGLDILVNNAGIMVSEPFLESSIETLRKQQSINVESVYFGMRTAMPLMQESLKKGGQTTSIINIASIYGKVAGAEYSAYSATKGAVRAMSKAVANELADKRIRVNCVLPGPIATNLSASWEPPRDENGNLISPEEALAAWTKLIPMGRIGMAEDIAPVVAFLASDMAAFVTGAEFIADGGYTAV